MTSKTTGPVLWSVDARGVATVTLNRPEVNNAYNGAMIDGLLAALDALGERRTCARSSSTATASTSRPAPT
jgi:enoyl-CoA hydratase/carnithine racemase